MIINLLHKIGSGLHPTMFIDGMTRNHDRLLDLYNQFKWSPNEEHYFRGLRGHDYFRCFIICTDWCPDVIWNAPVLFQVLEYAQIPTEVLIMEQHVDIMDQFLTNGGRAQPIAIFTDVNGDVLGKWGPRPQYIQELMEQFRRDNPDRDAPDYQERIVNKRNEIAEIYNKGTEYQTVIMQELHQLFVSMDTCKSSKASM
jgi:hypothetical protein